MKETVSFFFPSEDKCARTRIGGGGILIFRPISSGDCKIITARQCEDATTRLFFDRKIK
jgi:hypothetical protein